MSGKATAYPPDSDPRRLDGDASERAAFWRERAEVLLAERDVLRAENEGLRTELSELIEIHERTKARTVEILTSVGTPPPPGVLDPNPYASAKIAALARKGDL